MNKIIITTEQTFSLNLITKHEAAGVIITDENNLSEHKNTLTDKTHLHYLCSEFTYPKVKPFLHPEKQRNYEQLIDKYTFRQSISKQHPDFFFTKINICDLDHAALGLSNHKQYIIKPSKGFMSIGAETLNSSTNLHHLRVKLESAQQQLRQYYTSHQSVDWIIEEKITQGKEIAADFFYNSQGDPVIVTIYEHPKPRSGRYPQMLYETSGTIMEKYYLPLKNYLHQFNQYMQIRNMPIHAEFFIDEHNHLIPIEFNPGRFAGMGLAELAYHAYAFNPYAYLFNGKGADLDSHISAPSTFWLLAYNHSDPNTTQSPQRDLLLKEISQYAKVIKHVPVNEKRHPVFSLLYLTPISPNTKDLLLELNYDQFYR